MSYLLWQIFWCLLGTALLFFALGWLLRNRFRGNTANGDLVTGSETSSWQTALDGLRARLEAEIVSKLAVEKALEDSHRQQSRLSLLLDQHTVEIQTLTQELMDKNEALDQRDASTKQLRARIAELESQQGSSQDLAEERDALAGENIKLKGQASETAQKLAAAVSASVEAIGLGARIADLEPKLQASDAELAKLRGQVADIETKLRAAAEENGRLHAQVSQLQDWETRYTKTVAEKDEELSEYRSRVVELNEKLSIQNAQPVAAVVLQEVPPKDERDDLKKIYGVGPVLEKRLHELGVFYFRDIANWTKEDILRYEEHLKEFRDRIQRNNWVERAREEHFKKYGETLLKANSAQA